MVCRKWSVYMFNVLLKKYGEPDGTNVPNGIVFGI